MKAILVDDRTLILGSCNFDFLAYTMQVEVIAVITDPAAVGEALQNAGDTRAD